MKTKYLILVIVLANSIHSTFSQTLDLKVYYDYISTGNDLPENISRIEDRSGILNPFIGVWKGTINDRQITLKIEKGTYFDDYSNSTEDVLLTRFLLSDRNGLTISSTFDLNNDEISVIQSRYLSDGIMYNDFYEGGACGNWVQLDYKFLGKDPTTTKIMMQVGTVVRSEEIAGATLCTSGFPQPSFPTGEDIIFTKQ
ncbi:DUF6705 family protein [Nonlabens marinus]|uniref:DUF6705 domain-containing protein n=1 Tax=Nonlabens marinus S1-08 TaxID=1454201 RepID=W8VQI4_9FLAO|nr:DUF6705 family protein [Nonlabens marinus]BAO55105.1 hypothetical protein NMS_1096 [Nonlabens marinus S1-08]